MDDDNSKSAPTRLSLQPMDEFVTRDAGFQPGPTFSKQKIDMMIGLTLIVLLSACFNYTNLSLVRALRRSKEISVRKITGATRLQIFSQFMTEALLLSLIALIVGVGMFFFDQAGISKSTKSYSRRSCNVLTEYYPRSTALFSSIRHRCWLHCWLFPGTISFKTQSQCPIQRCQ